MYVSTLQGSEMYLDNRSLFWSGRVFTVGNLSCTWACLDNGAFDAPGLVHTTGPKLHLNISRLQEPVIHLDVSRLQEPGLV
jgi:hypothetical protein